MREDIRDTEKTEKLEINSTELLSKKYLEGHCDSAENDVYKHRI